MHVLGVGLLAAGVAVLLVLAGGIFWEEFKRLRYLHRLDRWAEDVETW